MKKSKAGRPRAGDSRTAWWSSNNHPTYVVLTLIIAVLGLVITLLGYIYTVHGPFNIFPKSEPRVTAQEHAYVAMTREGMEDGIALLDLSSEPPHLPDKFESSEYMNLRRRVADDLQKLREEEPSERLREFHADVILFLEKSQESATLMSRYSHTLDHDTFSRAADASTEAKRAMNRGAAALNRITNKQKRT